MSRIPVVFLPGLLCDERLWRDQSQDLSDIADPLVADLTCDDSVAGMALRVLAAAPGRFALVGLSMGGYVAFEIMRQAPERVIRLALLDTSAGPDSDIRSSQRKVGLASAKVGRFVGVTDRMLPRLVAADHVGGPVGDEVKAMAERVGGEAFLRQQAAILGRPDSRPMLHTIRVPTLVGVGDLDAVTPVAEALTIHRGIAGSRFHVFTGCGHLPALEQPAQTSALLRRWLSSASEQPGAAAA